MPPRRQKKTAPRSPRKKPRAKNGPAAPRQRRPEPSPPPDPAGVTTIRKYANRRLYDTAASRHITQEDLYRMVSHGAVVRILDASTEEDITNQTLTLALIEHDPAKFRLIPAWLLHQMIRLHEQALGGWLAALWQPFSTANPPNIPPWPAAAPMNFTPWNPWAGPAQPPANRSDQSGAQPPSVEPRTSESLDELRREVSRLLRRLGELEDRG